MRGITKKLMALGCVGIMAGIVGSPLGMSSVFAATISSTASTTCVPSAGLTSVISGLQVTAVYYSGSLVCTGTVKSITLQSILEESSNNSSWTTVFAPAALSATYTSSFSVGPYKYSDPTPLEYYRTELKARWTYTNGTSTSRTVFSRSYLIPFVLHAQ